MDILLGGGVFSKAVLHGWRFGPTRVPSAFKTCFGWVPNGEVKGKGKRATTHVCWAAVHIKTGSKARSLSAIRMIKRERKRVVLAGGMLAPGSTFTGKFIAIVN